MDSFFAKKGLTLSRNTHGNAQPSRELLLRSQEPNARPQIHPPNHAIHSLNKHAQILPPNNHHQNSREEKSSSISGGIRQFAHQTEANSLSKPPQARFLGFSPSKHQQNASISSRQENELSKLSMADISNRSFQTTLSILERHSANDRTEAYSEVKPNNKLKMVLESHRIQTESAKINKSGYLQSPSMRDKQQSNKVSLHPQNYSQRVLHERVAALQKQRQDLLAQLRKRDGKFIPQEWFQQKYALLKEINQKTTTIRDLQDKVASLQRQMKSRLNSLQFQLKVLQGSKSRLQNENQTNRRQWLLEKEKNEKAKEEMHRLIFFEDDLVHAKDYSRLKEQLQKVLTENSLMFQEHQQYIISVSQNRRALADHLEQVQQELAALKKEYAVHKSKIQAFTDSAEDKMQLIKLQNEINFLRKKGEESTEALINRQRQLQQVKISMKQLIAEHNQRSQAGQKFLQQLNLQQIKETIASYQSRLQDMAQALSQKTQEVNRLRVQLQNMTNEIRSSREERHINSIKQKSSENSLKNQIETLQRALQGQQEMTAKRIGNLEQSLQRKVKQIGEKDCFIKNFLLTRTKQLQSSDLKSLMVSLQEYFSSA